MSKFNKWLVLALISSALFLIVIDMTVLYTALPRLTHDLAATASQKLWIVNAYPLVMAGLLPAFGTLGDRYGHKRFFVTGLAIFGAASLMAAFAATPAILIAARVILAVGAAMMMPATLSIIRITFTDDRERSLAIGIWASVSSGGAGLGPIIGGFLLEHFWWGSVFLINIPIVIIALIASIFLIPRSEGNHSKKWDFIGSVQILIGLVGLVYAVKELSRLGGNLTVGLTAALIGAIAMFFFIKRQRSSSSPLIDLKLFKNPRFATGVLTAILANFALMGMEFVFTQRFQLVLGMTPLEAGVFTVAISIASFISGAALGLIMHRIEILKIQYVALLTAGIGVGSYLLFYDAAPFVQIICLVVFGIGVGAATTSSSASIMNNVPEEKAGMAASIEEVSFEIGGAFGIAILGSMASFLYTASLKIPAGLTVPPIARDSLDEALLAAESLPAQMGARLIEAAKTAYDESFVIVLSTSALLLLLAAVAVIVVSRRSKVS